jgi:hypothetical protein
MPSPFQRLKFAWDFFVRGKHRAGKIALPDFGYDEPDERLMRVLQDMYQSHSAEPVRLGNWIATNEGKVLSRVSLYVDRAEPGNFQIQTDFITLCAEGQHIVESFAGIGDDLTSAIKDACENFQESSFHVLLTTLSGQHCDHVDRERWTVGGWERNVTFGWLRMRGKMPMDDWPPIFDEIRSQVRSLPLSPGLHWMRYFYCRLPGSEPVMEVLLDNKTQEELQVRAAGMPWPQTDSVYTARLFFVIQDA